VTNVAPYANPFSIQGNTRATGGIKAPLMKNARDLLLLSEDESSDIFSQDSRRYGHNGVSEEGELGIDQDIDVASAGEITIPRSQGPQRRVGGQKMMEGGEEDPLRRTMANYEDDIPRTSQDRGPIYDSGEGPLPNAKKGGLRNNAVMNSNQSFAPQTGPRRGNV
jgi:hypothetical protein